MDGIKKIPHPEEAAKQLSRRTHSADPVDREFPYTLFRGGEGDLIWYVNFHPLSHDRDVRRVDGLHSDDVIAAIDVMNLAADPGGEIAQQVEPRAADVLDGDIPF